MSIGFPKGRPAMLEREDRKADREAIDEAENKKVRQRSCLKCGRPMYVSPAHLRRGDGKYCSKLCFDEARRKRGSPKECKHCGQVFVQHLGERLGTFNRRKFCSLKCNWAAQHDKFAAVRRTAIRICQQCGSECIGGVPAYMRSKKFCSRKCAQVNQRQKHDRRLAALKCRVCGSPPRSGQRRFGPNGFCSRACWNVERLKTAKTRRQVKCETCGSQFTAKYLYGWGQPDKLFERFCSKECRLERKRTVLAGEKSPLWRGGSDGHRGPGWTRLAESIRVRDGHVCQRCGKSEVENGQKLSVDHITPWREFTDKVKANDQDNLISLCRHCHSWKTNTAERKMLVGDMIQFQQYRQAIALPSMVSNVS